MVQWRLMQLIGEYEQQTGSRLSFRQLARATGLAETTVSTIANNSTRRVDLITINKLLLFFHDYLDRDLGVDDILHWEP